jgi:2-polyprenyl-6-methoxyphenol hydroxylase-like FAD-dependent oxidoreductase
MAEARSRGERAVIASEMLDLVVVGGGLAGAAVALAMVQRGARVVVLERETRFRDRVRGEGMSPWGVAEAKRLGIDRLMVEAGGRELRYWTSKVGPTEQRRDLVETTPQALPVISFSHPAMQEGDRKSKWLPVVKRARPLREAGVTSEPA